MDKLSININCNNEIIKKAIPEIEYVLNSKELEDYILCFKNKYGEKKFLQTENNNKWHYNAIVCGSELNTPNDYVWESVISFFMSNTEIYGYTDGKQNVIYLNEYYMDRSLPAICNTLIHEYCHLVGMSHSFFSSDEWPETAPYAIGCYAQYMIEKKLGYQTTKPFFPKASITRRIMYNIKRFFKNK